MSRSKNTIKFSDVSTSPVKLKYSASYSDSEFNGSGISIIRGVNYDTTSDRKVPQFKINYNLISQLFYKGYVSASLLQSGSSYDNSFQSTAASGTLDEDYRYFPTGSNAEIVAFYIPRNVFGEQIARGSFNLATNRYYIYDDGNGNLVDEYAGNVKVGNIIYSQAFAIITNPDYVCYFVNTSNFDFSVVQNSEPIVPSPSPSATPTVTPSISVTPTITPSITTTPTVTPTVSVTPSVTKTPGVTPSVTPSITTTPTVTPSITPSVSISISSTPSVTPSITPSITPSVSPVKEITIYSKAGNTITSGDTYSVYYSENGTSWTLLSSGLSTTNCLSQGVASISGTTVYVKAVRASDTGDIFINGSNSATCPSNLGVTCAYMLTGITGNTDVSITAYIESGDFVAC